MSININKMIDHTILKPVATEADIEKLCREAIENDFASVCINPCNIPVAKKILDGSDVKICTVVGFPLGANTITMKAVETAEAYDMGADEFDMVINIGALKDGKYDYVRDDIAAVVSAAKGKCVKVIIEAGLLTDDEKVMATKLSCEAGACFVKTSTGINTTGATVADVALMKANCTEGVKVKAAGGIKTAEFAMALVEAGAERIGTSSGIAIAADLAK